MSGLIRRNLMIFFKDKATAFFSLFGALIALILYVFFLGDVMAQGLQEQLGDSAKPFVFSWVFSGMISIVSFTATFSAFSAMIADKVYKMEKDLIASPLPRWKITLSYLIAAIVIGIVMSIIVLIIALIYLETLGMEPYSFLTILKILGMIVISTLSNTAVLLVLSMFINSINTFAGFTAVFSASLGFFTGTYVQIGLLSKFMQGVVKFIPVSHSAVIFRKIMMQPFFDGPKFEGAPEALVTDLRENLGVDFYAGNNLIPTWASILILLGVFVIFVGIAVMLRFKKKK